MKKIIWSINLILVLLTSVSAQTSYVQELNNWHNDRLDALKAPNGWLNLEGLFWLHPGVNSFGSADSNDLVFDDPTFPKQAGKFILEVSSVKWESAPGVELLIDGKSASKAIIFSEAAKKQPVSQLGQYRWTIIKREEKIGVRFRDLNSKQLKSFHGIERFPVDVKWKVRAKLLPANNHGLAITNVLGQSNFEKSSGKLQFEINGINYTLDTIDEGDGQLFIVFGDQTNDEITYPSGRFVYADKPGADGFTVLDFNKAINPPCAFTDFATCPIPPPQNILPMAITAGEKKYDNK